MVAVALAIIVLCALGLWVTIEIASTKYVDRSENVRRQSDNTDGSMPPSDESTKWQAEVVDSNTPAVIYRGGEEWWLGVVLGLIAGVASAIIEGGDEPLGAVVAVALNPIVWFGVYSLFKVQQSVTCPHCQRSEPMSDEFRNAPLGSVGRCPQCRNPIRKGGRQSQAMIG
jgi:hypothetical protein